MRDPLDQLFPPPRSLERASGGFAPPSERPLRVSLVGTRDERARARLLAQVGGEPVVEGADITLVVGEHGLPAQGYRLRVAPERVAVLAADDRGLAHAVATLRQLARAGVGEPWPACVIEDEPDFPVRGVMLDVSRDRVPRMEVLTGLIDRLADLKVNQLQLYTEHTFAYPGHEAVWRDASPLTPGEVRELDLLCVARHIDLVPNQQSLGHWHRWLTRPEYVHLAECPEGVAHPFSTTPEPFSLDVTNPATLELLASLYDQLLPCFTQRTLNVGLDETFDIGLGRARDACAARGKGRVYLEFLQQVHALVAARGHRMQFWGDVILAYPELVDELPRDAVALEWGYEAGHPFEEHAARFAASGLEFFVCPGTSAWQGPLGRTSNAERNLAEAARAGHAHGACGWLVTDWGDFGHWQPPAVSRPGLVLGAGHGWRADLALDREGWARAIDDHLPGPGAGRTLLELGDAYLAAGSACHNASPWFYVMRYAHEPYPPRLAPDATGAGFERVRELLVPHVGRDDELGTAAALADWGCRLGAALARRGAGTRPADLAAGERTALAGALRELLDPYRRDWLATCREGGLDDSLARFRHLIDLLR